MGGDAAQRHERRAAPRQKIEAAARSLYERYTARQRRRGETSADYAEARRRPRTPVWPGSGSDEPDALGGIARPLDGEWRGKRLAIVAAGALEYLPFAALPVPDRAPAIPLIARHEIVTIPSASVLAMLRRETGDRAPAPGCWRLWRTRCSTGPIRAS